MKKRKFVFFSFTYKHTLFLGDIIKEKQSVSTFKNFFWIFCLEASKLCQYFYLYFKIEELHLTHL